MTDRRTHIRDGSGGRAIHDIGGMDFGPIDRDEHDLAMWELRTDAMQRILSSPDKGVFKVDALRRTIEDYGEQQYDATTYYEKWIRALRNLCLEQGVISRTELAEREAAVRDAFAKEGRDAAREAVPDDGRGET